MKYTLIAALILAWLTAPVAAITCTSLYGTATCDCKNKCVATVNDCKCG